MKGKVNRRRRAVVTATAAPAKKKIVVDIPQALYEEAVQAVQARQTTTSGLVRQALEHYLEDLRRAKLEQELEAGYLANAALDKEINHEFRFADAELV